MKKILIISVSIFLLIFNLTGCAQEETDLFSKKEKCKEYISVMEEKVRIEQSYSNIPTEPIVFYSPSMDTCVGAYTVMVAGGATYFYIYDVLTNENIYNESSTLEDGMNGWNEYEAKKVELKK